jgi:hypothetical protein
MLSSSRKGGLSVAAGVTAACLGGTAGAAQVYYQPVVVLSTAYNTNIDLDPLHKQGAEGYFADVATNLGIATRTSDTVFQPRLLYNYYPSASYRNRLEGFLTMSGRYAWQRDRLNIIGLFDHRDDVNAEQPAAEANPIAPGTGNNPGGTGQVRTGTTRNYLFFDPTWTHSLTPLSNVGVDAQYQGMRYSPADTGHIDFNFYQGRLFYAKTIDLRTDFSVGAFGSRYQANTIDSHANSAGVQFNAGYNWTQVLKSDLQVAWQHTKFEETEPKVIEATGNPWSATLGTTYQQQVSSYRLSIGRAIQPNSGGGLFTTDQIRAQYNRDFTQRLHFMGAVRLFKDRTTTGNVGQVNTRNYATGTVRLEYSLTQRIFMAGSYTYIYQKYRLDPNSAQANIASLSFGYRGLGQQQ